VTDVAIMSSVKELEYENRRLKDINLGKAQVAGQAA
jgi:hypothetical protein